MRPAMEVGDVAMRVLLLNDSTTYGNWGGRAATTALRFMIREVGGDIVHTVAIDELVACAFGEPIAQQEPAPSRKRQLKDAVKPFIPPIALDVRRKFIHEPALPDEKRLIPRAWADYERAAAYLTGPQTPWPRLMRLFADVDVAVVFGDGDIYGTHLLPHTILFLSYLLRRHFDTPVAIVAHSADLDNAPLRSVAEHVYPLFDDVVFRDEVSQRDCASFCSGRLAADTSFWFRPAAKAIWAPIAHRPAFFDVWPDSAPLDPSRPYVCLGGSSHFDRADIDVGVEGYAALITRLASAYEGQIVLTVSDNVDNPVFRPLAKRFGLPLVGVSTPVQQVVDVLGNADAYIGGRYHPAIFALSGGAPLIPLSARTFKMQSLAEMASLPSHSYESRDLMTEAAQVAEHFLSFLAAGDELRGRLRSWADGMAADSWGNVAWLRAHGRDASAADVG
jgi:hypothetical protein